MQAELAAVSAVAALAAEELLLVVGILHPGMTLGLDSQGVAVQTQMDAVLCKTGKIGLQQEVVALVDDIGAELCQLVGLLILGKRIGEEALLKLFHFTEGIVAIISAIHFIHNKNLHIVGLSGSFPGSDLTFGTLSSSF